VLSTADADALATARRVLEEQSAIAVRTFTTGTDLIGSYNMGRVAESCDRAASVLFDALNAMTHHGHDDEAKRVLHT
jgi:hypothetical protein